MADQTKAPRLTSLSPGAGCACKLPLAKLEALFASMGDAVPAMGPASGDLLIGAAVYQAAVEVCGITAATNPAAKVK